MEHRGEDNFTVLILICDLLGHFLFHQNVRPHRKDGYIGDLHYERNQAKLWCQILLIMMKYTEKTNNCNAVRKFIAVEASDW